MTKSVAGRMLIVCALAVAVGSCDSAQRQDAEPRTLSREDIAQLAFPSVVTLLFSDAQGRPTAQGSGFYVADGVIATNYHVIEGAETGVARLVGSPNRMRIEQVIAVDAPRDLALVGTRETGPSLEITRSSPPAVGTAVYAVGNPRGLEGTFSEGIVSAIRPIGSDSIIQVTAAISPGSSGGPILDETGAVIGVATATFRGGQNLNFAMPAEYVRRLMEAPNPRPLSARATPTARSILSELGERASTGVTGSRLEWSIEYGANEFRAAGDYTFSLTNHTEYVISNVAVFVICNRSPLRLRNGLDSEVAVSVDMGAWMVRHARDVVSGTLGLPRWKRELPSWRRWSASRVH